ncbi:MAG: malate dehydrogenase [Candidatus Acetothermia bacterium]
MTKVTKNLHLAVIGTGRVGRATLLLLAYEPWLQKLTLVDTEPGVAGAVEEEMRHALASTRRDIQLQSSEKDAGVEGADIVLITAGTPRDEDMESRTELTRANGRIMAQIAEETYPCNPEARYVVVTNPVDAMATLFKELSGARWVMSTGTNLESQRFRAELAKQLDANVSSVSGFCGGEHGKEAVFLWSTVRIEGKPLEIYLREAGRRLNKSDMEERVKEISRQVIKYTGGTRHGPATSFRDILRSIALNENRILSVSSIQKRTPEEQVAVSVPQMVGASLGPTLESALTSQEKTALDRAAERIYRTYCTALES